MTSTYSSSLRLELMATGDQSGTWGDTTNTNLGTLLEQAITGYLSVAQGDVANLTLTTVNGGSDQNRNAIINVTGALTANRNVVVQTANKLYLVKNATTGGYSIVVKTASGTGVTIVNGASRWVYSDGTNVVDGQFGPLLPSSNDGGALGAVGTAWSDLYGATGFTLNLNNDWIATHSAAVLTVGTGDLRVTTAGTNAASVVTVGGTQTLTNKTMTSPVLNTPTVGTSLLPTTDDGAPLGSTSKEWSDLFLASGGVINWANGDVTITHSSNALDFAGATNGYYFAEPVRVGLVSGGTYNGNIYTSTSDQFPVFAWRSATTVKAQFVGDVSAQAVYLDAPGGFNVRDAVNGGNTVLATATNQRVVITGSLNRGAPVTKTGDFTVAVGENWIISNRGATNTVTLPAAASYTGREIMVRTIQAFTVVSASSNVVPRTGGAAGTAILPATDGAWATLVSDGTNWIIMQGAP